MSPRPVAAAVPPRVRERLLACPDGPVPVLHRGPHTVYVAVGDRCVGVVSAAAVRVPCALRVAGADLSGLDTGSARVLGGVLHLGDTPLRPARLLDVSVRAAAVDQSSVVEIPPSVIELVETIGCGPGLTPETDDVLCGWLAIHRAAGVPTPLLDARVRAALHRTTLLSATLLDCALHGEVVPEFAAYVAALGTRDEPARARALAGLGHTSGAALLRGARLGWTHLHRAGSHAA
ncbi:conserved hypothetical protein [metagenome]|uniref:DUF2877 domain-containing protein n=1 Tax=metagenome TaxID=256318 RepID=A0A2P2CFZ0_9ZZZZ